MSADRGCSVGGCLLPHCARGVCRPHYYQLRQSGAFAKANCSVNECDLPALNKGFCAKHYARWLRKGTMEISRLPPDPQRICSVDGCPRPSAARGWCKQHYTHWHKHGHPTEYNGPGQGWRPRGECPVCSSSQAASIDVMLFGGSPMRSLQSNVGITMGGIRRHARECLGLPEVTGTNRCIVCSHDLVDEIDAILEKRREIKARTGRKLFRDEWGLRSIAERFDVSKHSVYQHDTPEHQQRRALYELGRLNALKETA